MCFQRCSKSSTSQSFYNPDYSPERSVHGVSGTAEAGAMPCAEAVRTSGRLSTDWWGPCHHPTPCPIAQFPGCWQPGWSSKERQGWRSYLIQVRCHMIPEWDSLPDAYASSDTPKATSSLSRTEHPSVSELLVLCVWRKWERLETKQKELRGSRHKASCRGSWWQWRGAPMILSQRTKTFRTHCLSLHAAEWVLREWERPFNNQLLQK